VVAEVAPSADPISRTAPINLDISHNDNLRTGQFARVKLPGQNKQALFIPEAALVPSGQMERVFIAKDAKAELRLVRSGMRHDDVVEILSGLTPGETVIITNNKQLKDGQPIEIK